MLSSNVCVCMFVSQGRELFDKATQIAKLALRFFLFVFAMLSFSDFRSIMLIFEMRYFLVISEVPTTNGYVITINNRCIEFIFIKRQK